MSLSLRLKEANGQEELIDLTQNSFMIGSLLSNQIILRGERVDPIHALLEKTEENTWKLTDLGSEQGIKVNGKKIDVEIDLNLGDVFSIGDSRFEIVNTEALLKLPPPLPEPPRFAPKVPKKEKDPILQNVEKSSPNSSIFSRSGLLFTPNAAKPSGDVLEVVAYWGNTILEVEHFHPSLKGFEEVIIGDVPGCHFFAGGEAAIKRYKLASVRDGNYKLNLLPSMRARLRKGGQVEKASGGSHEMGRRDISQISFGEIRYFFLFMQPVEVALPKMKNKDPFLSTLLTFTMSLFFVLTIFLWNMNPVETNNVADDAWAVVNLNEKKKEIKVEKVKKPPPVIKQVEPEKVVKEVKPTQEEKPKIVEKKEVSTQMTENLQPKEKVKVETAKPAEKPIEKAANKNAGGQEGGGKGDGGQRKGHGKANVKGVQGAAVKQQSGINLSQLGLGVGSVSSQTGANAIHTNFKSSAGGVGAGDGTGAQDLGLGGIGSSHSVAVGGQGNRASGFGSGAGGVLDGKGVGNAFGQGRSARSVNVGSGDPLVSGGLTQGEIFGVIRANLNQIRHCYEKLLQRSPGSAGNMKVKFMIGLSGRVQSASIASSSIHDSTMNDCVLGVVERWKFNTPRGNSPVQVNYPFTFNPL